MLTAAFLGAVLGATVVHADVQDQVSAVIDSIAWQHGPGLVQIADIARIRLPDGFMFASGDDTRRLMHLLGNPTSGNEVGFVAPSSLAWFVIFQFSPVGYVSDDDRRNLDADALLETLRQHNRTANQERKQRGWSLFQIEGWQTRPHYDARTRNLEWAIRGRSAGDVVVNHNVRLLGRTGVMAAALVVDPAQLAQVRPVFHELMAGYGFQPGMRYSDYRKGDRLAGYGLAVLLAGGAAAAAKSGLLSGIWKVVTVASAALGGFLTKLLRRKRA
jgi:uncharacterized membrane-anchored protein